MYKLLVYRALVEEGITMTQVAIKLTHQAPKLTLITSPRKEAQFGIKTEILVLGSILAVLQVLDGVLTTLGVNHFGTEAEGNILLRSLMELIGHIPALIIAKGIALVVIAALCMLSNQISWVSRAFKLVIGIYILAAILPWTMILFTSVFAA